VTEDASTIAIAALSTDGLAARTDELAALLHACVHAGANINFVLPFGLADAAFWTAKVLPAVQGGTRVLLIAEDAGRVVGTVQLDTGTPPNQAHRAEITKLLVHPDSRRRGIARALMAEIETVARARDRSLITLDTRTGDAAEPLYTSLGYETAGIIPGFCRDPIADRLYPTTIMYKAV